MATWTLIIVLFFTDGSDSIMIKGQPQIIKIDGYSSENMCLMLGRRAANKLSKHFMITEAYQVTCIEAERPFKY